MAAHNEDCFTCCTEDRSEEIIDCCECGRLSHNVCVKYVEDIWREQYGFDFTCDDCLEVRGIEKAAKITASEYLPSTILSSKLESAVQGFLDEYNAGEKKVTIRAFSRTKTTHPDTILR